MCGGRFRNWNGSCGAAANLAGTPLFTVAIEEVTSSCPPGFCVNVALQVVPSGMFFIAAPGIIFLNGDKYCE